MNRKFWLCLCILFAVYNLTLLIRDRNSVHFFAVDEWDDYYDNETNFLICFRPESIFDGPEWRAFNGSYRLEQSVQLVNSKLKSRDLFHRSESYLFARWWACFPIEQAKLEQLSPVELSKFYTVLFVYSNGKVPLWIENVYVKPDGSDFGVRIQKQKVFAEAHLKRNCLGHANQMAANRQNCVQNCLKRHRSEQANYRYDELVARNDLKSGYEYLRFCLKNCPHNECFYEDYEVVEMRKEYYERYPESKKVELKTTTNRARYAITDFYLQFFGFLTLFTGSSLVSLLALSTKKLASSIKSKIKKRLRLNHIFSAAKFTIIFLCLLFSIYKSISIVWEFNHQLNYPNKAITLNSKYETQFLSLVVCFPIDTLILKRPFNSTKNLELVKALSFQEIKEATSLTNEISGLYLTFGGRRTRLRSSISGDVLFKNSSDVLFKNSSEQAYLSKCFRTEIIVDDAYRYKRMIPMQAMTIEFSNFDWEAYLIEQGAPLTSNLVRIRGEFKIALFKKLNMPSSKKANCFDYNQVDSDQRAENCSSRQHCVDSCVNREFYRKHRSLTIHSVLNQMHLNQFNQTALGGAFFNLTKDPEIESDCLKRFSRETCEIVYFDESPKATYAANRHNLTLNLNFDIFTEKEIEASAFKAALEVLNLLSILFGTNAPGLFVLPVYLFGKPAGFRQNPLIKFPLICLGLLGFSVHNYLIFREILHNDLFESAYFEKIEEFSIPNLIVCVELDERRIDPNVALTGRYLDELTEDLSYATLFDEIDYYENRWTGFFHQTHLNHPRSVFDLTHFYLSGLKCFEIAYKRSFLEDEFLTREHKYLYFVRFKSTSTRDQVYVSTKRKNSKEFSPFSRLKLSGFDEKRRRFFYNYRMKFEVSKVVVKDEFENLKNPSSLFYEKSNINDPTKYLGKIQWKFENDYGVATREILLKGGTALRIDDELFEQFYVQVQNVSDHRPSSLNTKQTLFNVYTPAFGKDPNFASFRFTVTFLKKVLKVRNEENYTKLAQSILTALSFWFDLTILDLFGTLKCLFKIVSVCLTLFNNLLVKCLRVLRKHLVRFKVYCKGKLKLKPLKPRS